MRRVLLTVHKFFPDHKAGTEVLTLKVGQELLRRGYEVLVVTADPPDVDARHAYGADTDEYDFEGLRVKVVREPLRLRGYKFSFEYDHPFIREYFDQVLFEFKPDLVHIFHAQNLSASVINAARARNIPVVCSTTDFWFVCPNVQLKQPDGTLCRGPKMRATNCLACHMPQLFPPQNQFEEAVCKKYPRLADSLKSLPKRISEVTVSALFGAYKATKVLSACSSTVQRPRSLRDTANSTNCIMVPTKLMADIFVENGINPSLIAHVPFGIDTAPLMDFSEKIPADELRVGFVGTLYEHKGVDTLIQAFQSLKPGKAAHLKIYGGIDQFADYSNKLLALAKSVLLPSNRQISFMGTFPNNQLGSVFQGIDVLVVPSRWYENTPLVVQSALACRTPVIATNLGGLSELIKHGENGLLFEVNRSESLALQLQSLMDEPNLLLRLTKNIKPERTIADMVDDIESVYRKTAPRQVHDRIAAVTS